MSGNNVISRMGREEGDGGHRYSSIETGLWMAVDIWSCQDKVLCIGSLALRPLLQTLKAFHQKATNITSCYVFLYFVNHFNSQESTQLISLKRVLMSLLCFMCTKTLISNSSQSFPTSWHKHTFAVFLHPLAGLYLHLPAALFSVYTLNTSTF